MGGGDGQPMSVEDVVSDPASNRTPLAYAESSSDQPSFFWARARSTQKEGEAVPACMRCFVSSQWPR
jgi:hypothetical protein